MSQRNTLLKFKNDAGNYVNVAGLRVEMLRLNGRLVDTASQGWEELLRGATVRTAEISGTGSFRDAHFDAVIHTMLPIAPPKTEE